LGRTLLVPVAALARWAVDHRIAIHAAQQKYDAEAGRKNAA
jgi:hypothetical protein